MQFSLQQFCYTKEEAQIQKQYFLLFRAVVQADDQA